MKINAFTKTYGARRVADFPGMEAGKGTIYAVVGANGSGKSTFARVVSGIEKSDSGEKITEGISVGYMPQKSYAFRMPVIKNLMLNGNDRSRAERLLEELNLTHLENSRAPKLSGGETARMALARMMMKDYDILILDEPAASMDMESTLLAEKLIKSYAEESGAAVILITHSLQQARRVSDRILYFEDGKLVETGETEKVLTEPDEAGTRRFLDFYGI